MHFTFKIKYLFSSNEVLKRKMAPMKLTFKNKLDSNDKEKIWYNGSCTLYTNTTLIVPCGILTAY